MADDLTIEHRSPTKWLNGGRGFLVAFLALLGGWSLELLHSYPMVVEFTDTLPLARSLLGEFTAVEGSMLSEVYPHLETFVPTAMAWLAGIGIPLETVQLLLVHISMWLGFCGIYAAAWHLSGSHWAGLIASLLITSTWMNTSSLGYSLFFWTHHPAIGAMSGAWVVAIWGLWLNLDQDRRWWPLPYVLVAILFYLHPTNAMVLGCCFGTAALITLIANRRRLRENLRPAIGTAIMAIGVLPQVISLIPAIGGAAAGKFDAHAWWALMALRKPHHVLIWTGATMASALALAVLSTALVALLSRHISSRTAVQLVGTIVTCFLFAAVSYLFAEVIPTPRVAGLVLSRSLDLVTVLIIAGGAAMAAIVARRGKNGLALLVGAIGPVLLAFGALPAASWLTMFSWAAPTAFVVALVVLALPRQRRGSKMALLNQAILPVALLAGVFVSGADKARADAANLATYLPTPHFSEMTAWIRDNTASDSLLLMPPYPAGTDATRRSNVLDHLYAGYSVYVLQALPFELEALRLIYGIDLADRSVADIQEMVAASKPAYAHCLFEQGYASMLESEDRVRAVEAAFHPDYVIGFQPGIMPDQWFCSHAPDRLLNLPIVFQNEMYVVFALAPASIE